LGAIIAMLIAAIVQLAGSAMVLVRSMRLHTQVCARNVETA
jgi:hypothetical protein